MLYNSCTGIHKFGNNIYPRRIRRRSNLGHIFSGKKIASYGPGNAVFCLMVRIFRLVLVIYIYIYIYIYSTNIPPIMIINRIYEHQNLLSL
jgi:hypothetical protein